MLILGAPESSHAQDLSSVLRLSENSSGQGISGGIGRPNLSPNGAFAVFRSSASNLVSADTNSNNDIFVVEIESGDVQRVNLGRNSQQGNGSSINPSISMQGPNDLYAVAFESDATNLTASGQIDQNGNTDIYLAISNLNFANERVSVGPLGVEPNGSSTQASVTITTEPDRILVSYTSQATNLVSGDSNNSTDIFLATITPPDSALDFNPATDVTTERISKSAAGLDSNGDSSGPQISANGKFIVYESAATNLVSGVTPSTNQIYLYNVAKGSTSLISKASDGTPGNDSSSAAFISFSGRFIVYMTEATNIIADGFTPQGSSLQVVLFDTKTGVSKRVNTSEDGVPGNGTSSNNMTATVSPNGRFVLFSDSASNLVSSDTNGEVDVFVKDLATEKISRLSTSASGAQANAASFGATLAFNGFTSRTGVASYVSAASNLIDDDTENNNDVFMSTFSVPALAFTRKTTLEVPPDAQVSGNRVLLDLEKFSGVSLGSQSALAGSRQVASAEKTVVRYQVEAFREGQKGKARDLRRRIIKKNQLTLGKLKTGTYIVRYQVLAMRGSKTLRRSKFSPSLRISRED